MAEALAAYKVEFGGIPHNPQQLTSFAKKRSDLPNVNYSMAKRLISAAKENGDIEAAAGKKNLPRPPAIQGRFSQKSPEQKEEHWDSYNKPWGSAARDRPISVHNPREAASPLADNNEATLDFSAKIAKLKKKVKEQGGDPDRSNATSAKKKNIVASKGMGLKPVGMRKDKKKIKISRAARAAGRNEEAIKVNLNSIRSKPKFGRMVIYNVNCLANLAENRFNCESIIEQGGIETAMEMMKYHKGNPAVMKELSRMLCNLARASPEYADMIASSGLLDECLEVIKNHGKECGKYALDVVDAVLKHSSNPKKEAQSLVDKGAVKVLVDALETNIDDGELAAGIVQTLNLLTQKDPEIAKVLGDQEVYKQILDALKIHPDNGKLAINACELLQSIAMANDAYLQGMKAYGAVGIISAAMQANPDLKKLVTSGAAALALLAGEDDITKALNVLFNHDKFNHKIISEALGLLGNLALIAENAMYIAHKGGVKGFLDFINFKCKGTNLSPEELQEIADAVRAEGRLLGDEETATEFYQQKGMNVMKTLTQRFPDDEKIMNAVVDAMENLAKHKNGQQMILESGILKDLTKVLVDHPEYDVFMRKYQGLLKHMPLDNKALVQQLVDAGLLDAIQKSLLAQYDNPEQVAAIMDLMKDLANYHPYLASGLVDANAAGIVTAIRANKDDPECLNHIFEGICALANADPYAIDKLKRAGLEDELVRILKGDNISDEVAQVVKNFYDRLGNDGTGDLGNLMAMLSGLGMPLQDTGKHIEETEVKNEEPDTLWTDPNVVIQGLKEMASLLNDPAYARQFIASGQVDNILDNIQNFYDNPDVVIPALEALLKCAMVDGAFPQLEEAGVPEAVIQCMLEHPDDVGVQLAGLNLLAGLAMHQDPLVTESLCQPITIETALKALNGNIQNPAIVGAFADFINNLMADQQQAPMIAQMLAGEGVLQALQVALDTHKDNPQVSMKVNQALASINPHLYKDPRLGQHEANVNPYGTITLAKLAQMSPEELANLMETYDTDELTTILRGAKDPRLVQSSAAEVNKRLNGGDGETYANVVNGGAIADLMRQAQNNFDNGGPLGACLDALGTLSNDDRLKTLLGMHGLIRLLLETIRRHPNDIELLDKCCYILSNLTFNNAQNMTQVIELGGVADIVGVLKKHTVVNFLCESSLNVLVNLCHNSDKNKTLISRSGGGKATIEALHQHNRCINDGDEAVVVASFRCLANLAYVPDNVKQLIKLNAVAVVMDTMANNTDKKDIIQMGVVVLANLSSHDKVAPVMVRLGVLDLIINVSKNYPDELEIQKSCLGCVGNLMNEQSNAVTFLDKKGHLRVFEIMEDLVFEESIVCLCLKLLKILATNTEIANQLCEDGGCKVTSSIMLENRSNVSILALGCQSLCKMIASMEAARIVNKEGLVEIVCDLAKENNNWANISVMNELIKVIVNFSALEDNAVPFSKNGSVSLLKAIEAHYDNAVFLNNAAMALSKLSIHPNASRHLVKRGAVPVIINSAQRNPDRRGILARYIRTLANLLYTEGKTGDAILSCNADSILESLVERHKDYKPMEQEWAAFQKALKMKSKKITTAHYSVPIRDRMQMNNVRLLSAGTVMRKHGDGKPKKKVVRANDDCTLILFEDPAGKKAAKQLNVKSIQGVKAGHENPSLKKVDPSNCITFVSVDPNGREFNILLECKTSQEANKWVVALQDLWDANVNAGSKM